MGSLTGITRTGMVGTCNTRSSNITGNGLQRPSSPTPSTSSSESMSPSTSSSESTSPSTSSSQSMTSTDSESTSDEEGSAPSPSERDADAVMRKRKLMDARCFRAIFSAGCYTKKIKLVHDNVDQNDQQAAEESVPCKLASPSSGEIGATPSPTCRNHSSLLPGGKDAKHELSQKACDGSSNLNQSSSSHKLDKKSDNDFHTDEHHAKNNIENDDDLSCEIAAHVGSTSRRLLVHCDSSSTQVDERDVTVGSCHTLGNNIGTSKTVDCNSGKNSSPSIEQDGVVGSSSRVSTDPILPLPVRPSQLNTDLCNGFYREAVPLSSRGRTTQVFNVKKVVNQVSDDSELEEGEIREKPQKSRCHTSEGTGIPSKGNDLQVELQSEHRCTKAEVVNERKSMVERAIRERTRKLLAQQMLEKDRFKKIMDLEEVKLREANEQDRERFAEHKSKQRRKLINLQILARNKEKRMHSQWLEDASNGNLSKSFDLIPLPSTGFSPEEFMLSPDISVCVADSSHVSEQEKDRTCDLGKTSGISSDQHFERKDDDSPSSTSNGIGKEVDEVRVMQSKGARAETEKQTQSNPQPYSQVSVQCHQGTPSLPHGSSQSYDSGLACQVPIYEENAHYDDAQETSQLKQTVASEQPILGPSSLKALDNTVESTKTSPSIESEGPKTAIGNGSCKDLLLCFSKPTKLALTEIIAQPSVAPNLQNAQELSSSESLGASMPESIKLPSGDLKVVPEQEPSLELEVPIHEPTDPDTGRGESGTKNLIAGPESSQVFEDNFLVSDVMGNVEPMDNSLVSRVSPPQCVDKIPPEKFQNSAISGGVESSQEATANEKRSETRSVANKTSDNCNTSLACNFHFTKDGPFILDEKFSMPNCVGNASTPDLCVPTSTELADTFFCSQPVGASLSPHIHKEEASISVSLQVPASQQIQSIPSGYGNSIVSSAMDSKQLPSSSQPLPVSLFEATPYDDDVIVLDPCHPTSSSESISFAAWVQSEASASGQADASAPKTIMEKQIPSLPINDPDAHSSKSLNLQVQSFSNDGHIHSGLPVSQAVAMTTTSEHHQGNSSSTARDRLSSKNAMTSNTNQLQLPSFVQTSNTLHAVRSDEPAQAVTSQVNKQTSNDTVRAPNYYCNSNALQGSTGVVSQRYVMTAQLPFRGILADPLANELSRILIEKDSVINMCNDAKAKVKSEYDIEVEKLTKKYETLLQNAAAEFLEKNGRLDIIYEQIKRNQFLATCYRSEMVGYDTSMDIITSLQGESSGTREQSGSSMGSASSAATVRMPANKNPLSDAGTIFSQGQSQSTIVIPVTPSMSSAPSSRQQFESGFIPASSMAVPISAANNTSYDTVRLSQAQLQGSAAYPVATSGSLTSSMRHNFGAGMASAPALGVVPTSASNNLGGRGVLPLPASAPSAGGMRHPFPSGMASSTAAGVISTALNTNPGSAIPWRQHFEPCVTSAPSGGTVPVSVSTYPQSNAAMFPPVQFQSTVPSPAASSVPLPGFSVRVNRSASTLMPSSSVAPIGSVVHPVISNSIRSPPPHLRYRPAMPIPRSMAQ